MASETQAPTVTLSSLASDISKHVTVIDKYLHDNNIAQPSFDPNGPPGIAAGIADTGVLQARMALIEAAKDLYRLAVGPADMLAWSALTAKYECACLRAINHYGIAQAVPLDGEASFAEIASKTDLHEDFVARIIRFAATDRIFAETKPGYVSHTTASATLAQDRATHAVVEHHMNDVFPATAKLNEAIEKFDYANGEPNETAFNLAYDTTTNLWEWYEKPENEERLKIFHEVMGSITKGPFDPEHIAQLDLWRKIPAEGLVVDVGGSMGHVSASIASKNPHLKFLIQDRPKVITEAKEHATSEMQKRLSFEPHDFWQPQTVTADVYLMRAILHDWPDKYAAKIIRNLVSAMKPGSRIALVEQVLPPPNVLPRSIERIQRGFDLQMMVALNARERDTAAWEKLVTMADERLHIEHITTPENSAMSLIVVGLRE